jgi:hypothetical protein
MRTLVIAIVSLGGVFALASTADAARKAKRINSPSYYYFTQPSQREQSLCEERARNEDPAGHFAGYPCWAREIFGRGRNSGGRGG